MEKIIVALLFVAALLAVSGCIEKGLSSLSSIPGMPFFNANTTAGPQPLPANATASAPLPTPSKRSVVAPEGTDDMPPPPPGN